MSFIKFFLHIPLIPRAKSSFGSNSLSPPFQLSIGYFQISLLLCSEVLVAFRKSDDDAELLGETAVLMIYVLGKNV